MDHQGQRDACAALSRRGFLRGAAGLALAAAGCGGGGGSSSGERYNGTYRSFDGARDVAASLTVDRNGLVTFWTLRGQDASGFADFGQVRLEDNRFGVTAGGVTTFGEISGGTARGRTEDADFPSFGFDWRASRAEPPAQPAPSREFTGSFEGRALIRGIDVFVLLGVSPDGNATFFGAFNDPTNDPVGAPDVDFYAFESFSINRSGVGYDYLLNEFGDRIDLRSDRGVRLLYTFGANSGEFEGDTFEVDLATRARPGGGAGRIPAGARGLRRPAAALRARGT